MNFMENPELRPPVPEGCRVIFEDHKNKRMFVAPFHNPGVPKSTRREFLETFGILAACLAIPAIPVTVDMLILDSALTKRMIREVMILTGDDRNP